MNRRGFLGALLGGAATVVAVDPEKLLWRAGRKLISIPKPATFNLDQFAQRYLEPAARRLADQMDEQFLKDYAFFMGEQWPADALSERRALGRPSLTVNRLPLIARDLIEKRKLGTLNATQQRALITEVVQKAGDCQRLLNYATSACAEYENARIPRFISADPLDPEKALVTQFYPRDNPYFVLIEEIEREANKELQKAFDFPAPIRA